MHVNDEARQSIMVSLFRSRRQVLRVNLSSALTRSRILSLSTKESRSRLRKERSEKRPPGIVSRLCTQSGGQGVDSSIGAVKKHSLFRFEYTLDGAVSLPTPLTPLALGCVCLRCT